MVGEAGSAALSARLDKRHPTTSAAFLSIQIRASLEESGPSVEEEPAAVEATINLEGETSTDLIKEDCDDDRCRTRVNIVSSFLRGNYYKPPQFRPT
jgi:hypothetical protein